MSKTTEAQNQAQKTTLAQIQAQVKAPKGQFNSFGKYNYRSCEDIMEAVKPVINPLGYWLIVTDQPVEIGGRIYIKATAILTNGTKETTYMADGYAREAETKKGMDDSQISGAASSYARKYALAGLFALDDNKDADATNNHADTKPQKPYLKPDTDAWNKAVAYLQKEGWNNVGKVESKYLLTEEHKKALQIQVEFE